MAKINYTELYRLLVIAVRGNSKAREAHVTSWFTVLLNAHGLLFNKYWPQNSDGRTPGAAEHDFSMLDKDKFSVVVELKSPTVSRDALKKTLLKQAFDYASKEKDFKKGIIVAFNGNNYFYTYVFCPAQQYKLPINEAKIIEGQIFEARDLKIFVEKVLLSNLKEVDKNVAELFGVKPLFKSLLKELKTSSKLSISIQEAVKKEFNLTQRNRSKTELELRNLVSSMERRRPYSQSFSKSLKRILKSNDCAPKVKKIIIQDLGPHGSVFPVNLAMNNAIEPLERNVK